ncbi:MAG: glutathione S-transferase [Myxococcota bacterium]|jgi:glutathione S-transferase
MYELIYWPFLPGRGEMVRLLLEDAGVDYLDAARRPEEAGGGVPLILSYRSGDAPGTPPFAPPILKDGELVLAQTAAICAYLAERHGLVPDDAAARATAQQHQLTLEDIVNEAHDTHHPVSSALHYEDQRQAAIAAAEQFRTTRLPTWLAYLERVVTQAEGHFLSAGFSYPDLTATFVLSGLKHAFPKTMPRLLKETPAVVALDQKTRARPRIAAYLTSDRRLPFNTNGIFRQIPELDP